MIYIREPNGKRNKMSVVRLILQWGIDYDMSENLFHFTLKSQYDMCMLSDNVFRSNLFIKLNITEENHRVSGQWNKQKLWDFVWELTVMGYPIAWLVKKCINN